MAARGARDAPLNCTASSPAASLGSDTRQVPGAEDAGPQEPAITLVILDGDALDGDRRQEKESLAAAS